MGFYVAPVYINGIRQNLESVKAYPNGQSNIKQAYIGAEQQIEISDCKICIFKNSSGPMLKKTEEISEIFANLPPFSLSIHKPWRVPGYAGCDHHNEVARLPAEVEKQAR